MCTKTYKNAHSSTICNSSKLEQKSIDSRLNHVSKLCYVYRHTVTHTHTLLIDTLLIDNNYIINVILYDNEDE